MKKKPPRPKETCLVREALIQYRGQPLSSAANLACPAAAVSLARKCVHSDSKEHFIALYLDGVNKPIAYSVVAIGTATSALVHPREVFQPAVCLGAVALIALHNHPSGDLTPSSEDRRATRVLAEAGQVLGIKLLDHIIWSRFGDYYAFSENESALFS